MKIPAGRDLRKSLITKEKAPDPQTATDQGADIMIDNI